MTHTLYLTIFSLLIYYFIYRFRLKIANLFKIIDFPNEKRKIHRVPTPKTASYSVAIFFIVILIINLFYEIFEQSFYGVLIGPLLIFIIGFLDDKYNLSPIIKTFSITIIILILCFTNNVFVIEKFYMRTFDFYFQLENFSIIFTVLCILCLINALNLSDGINGLAIGIIFFWLYYINQLYEFNYNFLTNIILINLFVIFINIYKGDHFLGDAGSLMLSSFIAILIIWLHNKNISHPASGASAEIILIIFILPVIDMLRLIFERLLKKKNPAYGDNQHFHHYLINKFGLKVSLLIYFLFLNIPIIFSIYTKIDKLLIILGVICVYSLFIYYYKSNQKKIS